MQNLINRLEKRGWKKSEIADALHQINHAKWTREEHQKRFDEHVYWILLAVIVAANFAISIALIPVLVALNGVRLYLIIILMGLIFGLLFELVIRGIEHLEKKHHVILVIFIPTAALVNFFVVSKISNKVIGDLGLGDSHNPFIFSFIYALCFIVPYLVYRFILKIEYYAPE